MKQKTLYTCEYCNTDYADKEKALECERSHKLLETATIVGVYKSVNSVRDGMPVKIRVKFKDSDKFVEYSR